MTRLCFVALMGAILFALMSCTSIKDARGIRVTSLSRNIDKSIDDYRACEDFSLTMKQVADYFSRAKLVGGFEFHNKAIIAACSYSGTLLLDGQKAKWIIYPAGAGSLYNNKGLNRMYLCEGTCCAINAGLC